MRISTPLLFTAALVAGLAASTDAGAASALAPTAPLVADGKTPATLEVLFDDPTAKVKVKADKGHIDNMTAVPGGILIAYTPPAVGAPDTAELSISVRGSQAHDDFSAKVDLVPGWASGFTISFDPPVVADNETTQVKVTANSKVSQADAARRLKIIASSGTLTPLVPSGTDWVARYTPPANAPNPLWAAFGIVDAAAPFESYGHASLAVTVVHSVTLDAPADSNNLLTVGGRQFGPMKASPAGKVAFSVALRPDQTQGTLATTPVSGDPTSKQVDLPVTSSPGVVFSPLPTSAAAGSTLPVLIYCTRADGSPCPATSLTLTPAGGTATTPVALSDGSIAAQWTMPAKGPATLQVAMGGANVASATVGVVAPPVLVTLGANPSTLPVGAKTFSIIAHEKDPQGTAIVGRTPDIGASGAQRTGGPRDNGDGTYTATFYLQGETARVHASPPLSGSGLPPRQILAWSDQPAVYADGHTQVSITVVATDALGLPVPNVDLHLSVPIGDGSVAPTAKTGADGAARVTYKVGTAVGAVGIVAAANGLTGIAPMWQAAPGTGAPEVHSTGSQTTLDAIAHWQAIMPTLIVAPATVQAVTQAPIAVAPLPVAPPPTPTGSTPPAMGTPAATPSTSSSTGTPQKIKAPKSGSKAGGLGVQGEPWLRASGCVFDAPFSYHATLKGNAADYAPEASFAASPALGAFGADAHLGAWFGSTPIGMDLRAQGTLFRVSAGGANFVGVVPDFEGAVRYRLDEKVAVVYGIGGVAYTDGQVFAYANDARTAARLVNYPLFGVRLGGGAYIANDARLFSAELTELFAPFPVLTNLELGADVPLAQKGLAVHIGLAGWLRHMTYSIEDSHIRVFQAGLTLEGGVTLMLF